MRLIGIVTFIIALTLYGMRIKTIFTYSQTEGTAIGSVVKRSGSHQTSLSIISYTVNNQNYKIESIMGKTYASPYSKGSKHIIKFDPNNPSRAFVKDGFYWALPTITLAFSLLFYGLGYGIYLCKKQNELEA